MISNEVQRYSMNLGKKNARAARASGREAKPWTGKARQSMRKTKRKIGGRGPRKASLSPRIKKRIEQPRNEATKVQAASQPPDGQPQSASRTGHHDCLLYTS